MSKILTREEPQDAGGLCELEVALLRRTGGAPETPFVAPKERNNCASQMLGFGEAPEKLSRGAGEGADGPFQGLDFEDIRNAAIKKNPCAMGFG